MWTLNFDTSKDEIELSLGIRSFTKWIKLTFQGHFTWVPSPTHVSKSQHGGKVSTFQSQKPIEIGLIIIKFRFFIILSKKLVRLVITMFNHVGHSTNPRIYPLYYVGLLNNLVIFIHCSYIHAATWKFGWDYTRIIVHPNNIHTAHCSFDHFPLKILFITTLSLTIPPLFIFGISFFLLSKLLLINVR